MKLAIVVQDSGNSKIGRVSTTYAPTVHCVDCPLRGAGCYAQHGMVGMHVRKIDAAALIRDFPEYYRYYSIREYRYNNISQPNRNRLLWLDPNVDGVKTGYTPGAGKCLVAAVQRGRTRVLVVLLDAADRWWAAAGVIEMAFDEAKARQQH